MAKHVELVERWTATSRVASFAPSDAIRVTLWLEAAPFGFCDLSPDAEPGSLVSGGVWRGGGQGPIWSGSAGGFS